MSRGATFRFKQKTLETVTKHLKAGTLCDVSTLSSYPSLIHVSCAESSWGDAANHSSAALSLCGTKLSADHGRTWTDLPSSAHQMGKMAVAVALAEQKEKDAARALRPALKDGGALSLADYL